MCVFSSTNVKYIYKSPPFDFIQYLNLFGKMKMVFCTSSKKFYSHFDFKAMFKALIFS